ncbi:MAG TPA: type III pantothenate kinase [Firmicutes bacterium]|nr:type III pantothenate kinase [Bacillota bacterium]
MLLVIDIGNTNTVMGVYDGKRLVTDWRISTDRQKTADEYAMLLRELLGSAGLRTGDVDGIAISCVVPPVITAFEGMCAKYFKVIPMIVGPGTRTGMIIRYENPKEVGADRVVNAVAAYEQYGGPAIIVDFGTATTFCAISERGEYLGGVIAPGVGISSEALFQRAAKLPRVELIKPETVIGRNTVASMQSGIIYGFAGLVDAIVSRMKREMGREALVVATGGFAELIGTECREIDKIDPYLTLEGLRILYERNLSEKNPVSNLR